MNVEVVVHPLATFEELMGLPEGALVVLDECHKSFPIKTTPADVEEFFVEHGHKLLDFVLLSASMETMVARPIILLAGLIVRLKRLHSLGASFAYYRTVHDDLRGMAVSGKFRWYTKAGVNRYRSHTMAQGNSEAARVGGGTIFFTKPFILIYLFLIAAGYYFSTQRVSFNPLKPSKPPALGAAASSVPPTQSVPVAVQPIPPMVYNHSGVLVASAVSSVPSFPVSAVVPSKPVLELPYPRSMIIYVTGYSSSSSRPDWHYYQFTAELGQNKPLITQMGLLKAGYRIQAIHNCLVKLTHRDDPDFVQYAYCLTKDNDSSNLKHEYSADGRTTQIITPPPTSSLSTAQPVPINFKP